MHRYFLASLFTIAAVSIAVSAQRKDAEVSKDLLQLAATERAFSATAVKEGFRDSFIKFFAADGINFAPQPQKTRETLMARAPQTGPRTVIFKWQPMFGDISAAGDMGYTTGPLIFEDVTADPKPPRHGIYFSVWQKQSDGTWKVAVDMGADTPTAVAPIDVDFVPAIQPKRRPKTSVLKDVGTLDANFSIALSSSQPLKAYGATLASQFRIHRDGMIPVTSGDVLEFMPVWPTKVEFIGGRVARSNDMAFTYGKYSAAGKDAEEGYYVHVWRVDASGNWKLAVEIQNPLPKNK